jgi:2-dehydro-3-deoxyglucarate aldolase
MPETSEFRSRLRAGELLIGTIVTSPSPENVEVLVAAGFDWLFVDTEHSPIDPADAQAILQAAGERCPCLIRIPVCEEMWVKKALDIGAAGIIVPRVDVPEAAHRVVAWSKYPPAGTRGIGLSRAHRYGLNFNAYLACANERLAIVIQAEHAQAVDNIEALARVPGVDAIFVGPYDLSASLGVTGRMDDTALVHSVQRIKAACLEAGMALGIFGADAQAVKPWIEDGYSLIAVGTDALFMASAARGALAGLGR